MIKGTRSLVVFSFYARKGLEPCTYKRRNANAARTLALEAKGILTC